MSRLQFDHVALIVLFCLQLDDEASTANHVKKSMSGFLSHVAEVFTPPPDDDDEEAFVISNQQPVMLSRLEVSLLSFS